ncbi:nitroimidazol reductase NimA-like FMN-containing flavoprotein (pyridoxamine 5'-phosphate oxidase superfamily) [Methanolinea mesophila]|uniref:pyridoxamine 5'-phosphate oxidase family protein n=1 Tax=Methanolinea mesophila TaxID=547055 RepID=UPI001AE3D77A|nr:pyridoxamine 5'-phosphate oxidase family protein [Methanolinea mesophila]MBP1928821.1 nitroimidazol reductase NimA-like FMN-containing flavoprotein (pyridoxamine 5'-phosphate oxidase superfamily) [Methanolinea mesophila]
MMRRGERERNDPAWIAEVLRDARVCRVAFAGPEPYVVPLCFGYEENRIYLHSAPEGKKMDLFSGNPKVCVEFETGVELVTGGPPCDWGMKYRTVISSGTARLVEDEDEKLRALSLIAKHYGAKGTITPGMAGKVAVIRIDLEEVSGKTAGYS